MIDSQNDSGSGAMVIGLGVRKSLFIETWKNSELAQFKAPVPTKILSAIRGLLRFIPFGKISLVIALLCAQRYAVLSRNDPPFYPWHGAHTLIPAQLQAAYPHGIIRELLGDHASVRRKGRTYETLSAEC